MHIYKEYGKDINVVEWYKKFRGEVQLDLKNKVETNQVKERFLNALGDLKYIGIVGDSG